MLSAFNFDDLNTGANTLFTEVLITVLHNCDDISVHYAKVFDLQNPFDAIYSRKTDRYKHQVRCVDGEIFKAFPNYCIENNGPDFKR